MNRTKELAVSLIVLILLVLMMWWPIYKYHDCRKVGHSILYCVVDIGK